LETGLAKIRERVLTARKIALFLDFDGTLARTVSDPEEARLEASVRETLTGLAGHSVILTTVISGRSLRDVRKRVGVEGIVYAGNHGLEISGRHIEFIESVAVARRDQVRRLSQMLGANLTGIAGAAVEDKGLSVSVHYRNADRNDFPRIESIVRETLEPLAPLFQLNDGQLVWEIAPKTDWNKGTAAAWIHDRLTAGSGLVVFIGNDRTDEDAFRRYRNGITVRVGSPEATFANFYVSRPEEVHEFLQWLVAARLPEGDVQRHE